jgi:hypothetical protein
MQKGAPGLREPCLCNQLKEMDTLALLVRVHGMPVQSGLGRVKMLDP